MSTNSDRLISQSEVNLHRKCPQAWNYQYYQHLETVEDTVPIPREFGSWWHAVRAADSIHRGITLGSLLSAPDEITTGDIGPVLERDPESFAYRPKGSKDGYDVVTSETIFLLADKFWKTLSADEQDRWTEVIGGTLSDRLRSIDSRWRNTWAKDLKFEEPIAVEVKVIRSLATGLSFKGTADEIYRDKRRNLIVARDHKTSKTLAAADSVDNLMDSQLHLYAWALSKWLKDNHGLTINATAYDRVRSAAPKMPSVTQAGQLSKSVTDYDLDTYLEWVKDGVPWGTEGEFYKSGAKKGEAKFGVYEADEKVIENLSTPASRSAWHQRTLAPLNRNIVRAHLQALLDTYSDIKRTTERLEKPGSDAGRNFSRMCGFCDYLELCHAQIIGGPDGEYDLKSLGLTVRVDPDATPK